MPWFVPPLTNDEESAFIQPGGPSIPHKVGRWPHPNTDRVDARFIMRHMDPLAHTANRRLFCVSTDDTSDFLNFPHWSLFGHWDIEVIADHHLQQTVTANVHGWDLIVDFQSFDVLPFKGNPGIEVKFKTSHAASGHWHQKTFEFDHGIMPFTWNTVAAGTLVIQSETTESPAFPYNFVKFFDWPMSDCFLFERAPPAPLDFAEFNGVDTSILFDGFTNTTAARHQTEFDIRFKDTSSNAVLARSNNSTRWLNVNVTGCQWRSTVTSFGSSLNINQWYRVRLEFNWNDPGTNWKLYLDGVLDGTNPTSGSSSLFFNLMGKRGATYVGNFDLKNLTLQDTDPASPRLLLSTELQVNACDIGEKTLKGTTENMTLSSCP